MTPQKAKSDSDIATLPFDNITLSGEAWAMLMPDVVTIAEGAMIVTLSRKDFEALVEWYQTGKLPKTETRKPDETEEAHPNG